MSTTLVCLGDSLTGPRPGVSYLDKYIKWTDLLQVGLAAVFGEEQVRVLNQGFAGDPSSRMLAALDDRLLRHQPDIAVMLIGANNYAGNADRDKTSAALRSDLESIVSQAQAAGTRVLLLQYPRPLAEDMSKVWIHGDAGNQVIAEVAASTGASLLPLAPLFDHEASRRPLAELASPVDGVHLNPGGELVIANAVLAKLRELGWPTAWPGSR